MIFKVFELRSWFIHTRYDVSFLSNQLYDFASEVILTFGLSRLSLLNFGSYVHMLAMIGHMQPFVSSVHSFFLYLNKSMVEPGRKLLSKRTCLKVLMVRQNHTKSEDPYPFSHGKWPFSRLETKLISAGPCFFIFMMGGRVKRYTGFHPRIGISPMFSGCFAGEAMLNFREGGIP